jgi:hypothetical protein
VSPLATGMQRTKDYISEIATSIPGVEGITIDLK